MTRPQIGLLLIQNLHHLSIYKVGSNLVINVTASENSLSISDAIGDTSLQQISNGY